MVVRVLWEICHTSSEIFVPLMVWSIVTQILSSPLKILQDHAYTPLDLMLLQDGQPYYVPKRWIQIMSIRVIVVLLLVWKNVSSTLNSSAMGWLYWWSSTHTVLQVAISTLRNHAHWLILYRGYAAIVAGEPFPAWVLPSLLLGNLSSCQCSLCSVRGRSFG